MDMISRIYELLEERGWSKYRLAKEAKISQSTIVSVMRRGNNPTVHTIESCCNAFGITLSEFFDDSQRNHDISLEDRKMMADFHRLTPSGQDAVKQMILALLNTDVQ